MTKILIFCLLAFAAIIKADTNCAIRPPYVNPRTCCLDPVIVTKELHDTCMKRAETFNVPENNENDDEESDVPDVNDNLINSPRNKRSIDDKSSSEQTSEQSSSEDSEVGEQKVDKSSSEEVSKSGSRKHHKHHHGRHSHGRHHHRRPHHHHGRHHHGHNRHHHHHPRHHEETDETNKHLYHHQEFSKWSSPSVRFQKLSIYWSCVFDESAIIQNHTVNMDNVKTYLSEALEGNDLFLQITADAFETCKAKGDEFRENIKNLREHYVHETSKVETEDIRKQHTVYRNSLKHHRRGSHGFYLIKCVKRETFKNCPEEKFRGDDKLCNKAREYAKSCPFNPLHHFQKKHHK